jgi:hypothetical protein
MVIIYGWRISFEAYKINEGVVCKVHSGALLYFLFSIINAVLFFQTACLSEQLAQFIFNRVFS